MTNDPLISIFPNTNITKTGESINLSEFLDRVKSGYWQDQVLYYRNNVSLENKKKLPLVTISGLFSQRGNDHLTAHSGFIAIDIDGLKNLNDVREQICCDPNFYAVFVSCGGSGLCAIASIEPKLHLESFYHLSKYLYDKYNIIEVDIACKDVARARFVSYDPDLWINKDAQLVKVKPFPKKEKEETSYVFVESEFTDLVNAIRKQKVDIVSDYKDWVNVGFALASKFGDNGRNYFHALSEIGLDYNQIKADRKFDHLLKTGSKNLPIDIVYNLAKRYNIEVKAVDEKNIVNKIKKFIEANYKMSRNEISRNIELNNKPITDIDLNSIFTACKTSIKQTTKDLVKSIIFSDFTPSFNPFFQFLELNRKNKPTGNIENLIKSIDTDTPNYGMFITKWLASLIASIDGKHSPLVLVLVGDQNTGKTEWFRRLLPDKLKPYYAEDKLDQGKDSDILMTKKLIIMDDEMGGKSKAESKMLNRLTSSQTFSIREPYGVVSVDLNRLAMLCGTTNIEGVLNDPTGNRRMLPIRVKSVNFELYNSIKKDDLFTEIYHLYRSGYNHNLTGEEIKILNDSTGEFKAVSQEEDMILKFYRKPLENEYCEFVTATEILSNIKMKAQISLSPVMIGLRLKNLGFTKIMKKIDGYATFRWEVVGLTYLPDNNLTTINSDDDPFNERKGR